MIGKKLGLIAALGMMTVLAESHAQAQTIGFADAYDRLAAACGRDIDKLCANVALGGGAVKSCLEKNKAKISVECKSTMAETFQSLAKRETAQATARQVCARDITQYCSKVQPHDGYVLQCLLTSTRVVSATCKQVIVDAGWN